MDSSEIWSEGVGYDKENKLSEMMEGSKEANQMEMVLSYSGVGVMRSEMTDVMCDSEDERRDLRIQASLELYNFGMLSHERARNENVAESVIFVKGENLIPLQLDS